MKRSFLLNVLFLLSAAALAACQAEAPETATAPPATDTATAAAAPAAEAITFEGEFQTPESVLYDEGEDYYYVSNINGSPFGQDDNGYISRINAETREVEAKWIDGADPDTVLNAPKGMAIVGDELWVTDIGVIRRFNRKTREAGRPIPIAGATFLNDLASSGTDVYVSDSGLQPDGENFAPSGTDAVYRVSQDGSFEAIARGSDLNRPNGLAVEGNDIWAVTFGAAELYRIENGTKSDVRTLPQGSLDGLVRLGDGTFLVSSWDANAVYQSRPDGSFQPVVEGVTSPADIGFDSKRRLILVPHFMENRVTGWTLPQE